MGKSKKIKCRNSGEIPAVNKIIKMTKRDKALVLQIKDTKIDKESVIQQILREIPEYDVFDSGGDYKTTWITIQPPLSKRSIKLLKPVIDKARQSYLDIGGRLMEEFQNEELPEEWEVFEHGDQRRFEHIQTGQCFETPRNEHLLVNHIDPGFLLKYMETTSGFKKKVAKLDMDYHTVQKILELLQNKK